MLTHGVSPSSKREYRVHFGFFPGVNISKTFLARTAGEARREAARMIPGLFPGLDSDLWIGGVEEVQGRETEAGTAESLSSAAESYLEDDEFQERFCRDCDYITTTPDEINDWDGGCPGETTCPADFCPSAWGCPYHERYREIEEALREVDALWN